MEVREQTVRGKPCLGQPTTGIMLRRCRIP